MNLKQIKISSHSVCNIFITTYGHVLCLAGKIIFWWVCKERMKNLNHVTSRDKEIEHVAYFAHWYIFLFALWLCQQYPITFHVLICYACYTNASISKNAVSCFIMQAKEWSTESNRKAMLDVHICNYLGLYRLLPVIGYKNPAWYQFYTSILLNLNLKYDDWNNCQM